MNSKLRGVCWECLHDFKDSTRIRIGYPQTPTFVFCSWKCVVKYARRKIEELKRDR